MRGSGGTAKKESLARRFFHDLRDPSHHYRRWWNLCIFLISIYNAVSIPMRFSFHDVWESSTATPVLFALDYLGDAWLLMDLVLNFYTPFYSSGVMVTDAEQIRKHYLRGWFTTDLLANVPAAEFSFVPWKHALLRIPRLLRLLKYKEYYRLWEQYSYGNETVIRLSKLLGGLFMILHWIGCSYMAFGYWRGFGSTDFLPPANIRNGSLGTQYLYGFFWAVRALMGAGGFVEYPTDTFERRWSILLTAISVVVVAIVIGNVVDIISQTTEEEEEFRTRIAKINVFMSARQFPKALQDRIRHYYLTTMRYRGAMDDASLLDELPANLRTQAIYFMHEEIIRKVPLFRQFSKPFISALVGRLRSNIYAEGDMVVVEGEVGSEMYFIRRGHVSVIVGDKEVAQLRDGAFFGEIALLEDETRRTASIRALTFCELFVLTRDDMDAVCRTFPEERGVLRRVAEERKARDKLRKSLCDEPLLASVSEGFMRELCDSFAVENIKSGSRVFRATDPIEKLFFVAAGEVHILQPPKVPPAAPHHRRKSSSTSASVSGSSPPTASAAPDTNDAAAAPPLARAASEMEMSARPPSLLQRTLSLSVGEVQDRAPRLVARLHAGNFFGAMGASTWRALMRNLSGERSTYTVDAVVVSSAEAPMIFSLSHRNMETLGQRYPDEVKTLHRFVRQYRSWVMIAKHRFLSLIRNRVRLAPLVRPDTLQFCARHNIAPPQAQMGDALLPQLLREIHALNHEDLTRELKDMTNSELLLASECLQALLRKFARHSFLKAHAHARHHPHGPPRADSRSRLSPTVVV